jgi:hypothetical protein
MKLTIHPNEALKMLQRIRNKKLQGALFRRWGVANDWTVYRPSIFWLFCWCYNGAGRERTRMEAISVWDGVMPIRFSITSRPSILKKRVGADTRIFLRAILRSLLKK